MIGNIAETRLPQTQKCMIYSGAKFYITINIGPNKDDLKKNLQETSKILPILKTLCKISARIIVFRLLPYAWLKRCD